MGRAPGGARAARGHLGEGVEHVVLSSNAADAQITVCYGINHHRLDPREHRLISNASCTGDRVVVAKFMYGFFLPLMDEAVLNWGTPEAGDVVIVHSPADNIDIVKRVIGVPGDTIEIREDVVYRNGDPLQIRIAGTCEGSEYDEFGENCQWVEEGIQEHTWHTSRSDLRVPDSLEESVVPEGHIFVLGDHRDRSNDSRNPRVGMIPVTRVKGRALAIYWSSNDGGAVRWGRLFEGVR